MNITEFSWKDVGALAVAIVGFVVYAAIVAGIIYVALHFITKYW
jgi:hypothetical protein